MSGGPLALVVYAGQMATYVCEGGDVQPTYPILHPITEELLLLLRQDQSQSLVTDWCTSASASTTTHASGDRAWLLKQKAQGIRSCLLPLMQGRLVLLVVPLSSTASYREAWTQLCFDGHVLARRLIMLSDTVASAFACGMNSGVVIHASLSTVSMCRVEAGCSTRYSNSHLGSVQMLCGPKLSMQLTEEWSKLALVVSTPNSSTSMRAFEVTKGAELDTAREGGADKQHPESHRLMGLVKLTGAEYRDSLIRTFGLKAYTAVIIRAQMKEQERQESRAISSKGKGKGGNRQGSLSPLDELRQRYPRAVRQAPGQLEKLLARVAQGGPTTPVSAAPLEGGEPCVLAGEALAIPYVRALFEYVVRNCGDDTWRVVKREQRGRKRSSTTRWRPHRPRSGRSDDQRSSSNEAKTEAMCSDANSDSAETFRGTRQHTSDSSGEEDNGSEEDTEEETESSSSDSSSDSSSMASLLDNSDDDTWLRSQTTPLPSAPWWLPLLGGSIVSRLSDKDLQRAIITAEEARETRGTVIHWRMLI
ncbi:hypothetical protein JKF63_02947 [Porcisia hertigi]|uniref:Uncharacterized protein n=1 Tax=Porcisia hertigi TaxID=2761500 RepID=A0A836HT68_9TRYP|nr:hypothetical protein JKF63_02947 [Porcisia hertigi]